MKKLIIAILAALASPLAAMAASTDIAQVPVMNISGTGSIKPNIMLLLDNSGSMDWAYMPDYVGGGTISGSAGKMCRTGSSLSNGTTTCTPGYPPFMASDFNGVYYNPNVYYQPPVTASGTTYASMTSANTVGWTQVPADGYNIQNNDMFGNSTTTTNLLTGFPDKRWCNSSSVCMTNSSYNYPDSNYKTAGTIYTNPYYYNINVQEYCTDATLSVCQSVVAGSAAPAAYPVPAKVRWCNNINLTDNGSATNPSCQAKYTTTYFYPRFSVGLPGAVSYGTIAIGPTTTATKAGNGIAGVTVNGLSIISASVSTSTYAPNTAAGQQELATRLASAIIANTSTVYIACVATPNVTTSPTVSACSTYGITLGQNNLVAVIPTSSCTAAITTTNKATVCTPIYDSTYAGYTIAPTSLTLTVTPAAPAVNPTGIITFSGTTANSGSPTLNNSLAGSLTITLGGTTVYSASISLGKNKSAATVASTVATAIGTGGSIKAYVGGNAITATCASKTTSSVCLVDTTTITNGRAIAVGSLTSGGTLAIATTNTAGGAAATAAVTDSVSPLTGSTIAAGNGSPDPFTRVDIEPATTSYPKATGRTDCTAQAGVCTYAEEMTNFANWYTYYHTRMQMMKSSTGLAFSALGGSYRVGFAQLSNVGFGHAVDMLPADFSGANRTTWYSKLYASNPANGTPLREALNAIGLMYSNLSSGVISYPCQQNFTIVTTDGYWNAGTYSGGGVLNNDNSVNASRFCTKTGGCYDGKASPAMAPSLADVALYWYNGGSNTSTASLRPDLEPSVASVGTVPANSADPNTHLHMTTFTLGLGVNGYMTYEKNYDTSPVVGGDFYKLITSATGCPWNSNGTYIWPDPVGDTQTAVDDLWHAGVNGHGKYFSARDPQGVVSGLSTAIAAMAVRTGAASAAATSTPNVSQQDNDIFSATFTTVLWYGELFDQKVDPTTGNVLSALNWTSTNTLGLQVAAATDTRTIKMLDVSVNPPILKDFKYSAMNGTEQGWFNSKGSQLVQYGSLTAPNQAIANSGTNLVDWLRGQQQYADGNIYRAYTQTPATAPTNFTGTWNAGIPIVLGDIDTAKPAYLRKSLKNYSATTPNVSGYSTFVGNNATRNATVFAAANDGMLHAFDAATGSELWAYAPRITMSKLYKQAGTDYGSNHQFTVDGSPEIADVKIGGQWKTVLVGGLNAGGRGYYALDITNPAAPVALWEFCADSSICANNDPDMGFTFGNPQFGYWNNQWVVMVTSGYNNTPGADGVATPAASGVGYLYVLDVETGAKLKKISTGVGNTTTPSGFSKITSITNNPQTDPNITYVYGGDNQGNLFRFDFTDPTFATVPVVTLATLGTTQPITTRPDVSLCLAGKTLQRVVLVGTGRLLGVSDTSTTGTQSVYLVKDTGTPLNALNGNATMVKQTLSLQAGTGGTSYTITTNPVDLSLGNVNGWYTDLTLNSGERINLDPKVVFNTAVVVSNVPTSASACTVGGTSYDYQFDLCTGSYTDATTQTVGGVLSNSSAAVGFIVVKLPSGVVKMITTTADGSKTTSSVKVSKSSAPRKSGWRSVKNN